MVTVVKHGLCQLHTHSNIHVSERERILMFVIVWCVTNEKVNLDKEPLT